MPEPLALSVEHGALVVGDVTGPVDCHIRGGPSAFLLESAGGFITGPDAAGGQDARVGHESVGGARAAKLLPPVQHGGKILHRAAFHHEQAAARARGGDERRGDRPDAPRRCRCSRRARFVPRAAIRSRPAELISQPDEYDFVSGPYSAPGQWTVLGGRGGAMRTGIRWGLAAALALVLGGCDWSAYLSGPTHASFSGDDKVTTADAGALVKGWTWTPDAGTMPGQPSGGMYAAPPWSTT